MTAPESWQQRVDARSVHIGICGLGYVGLPLALLFARKGIRVTGFDVDTAKVEALNSGRSYIHRISGDEIQRAQKCGFSATGNFAAIAGVDAVLICVPTPLSDHRTPDMSYIEATLRAISPHLRDGHLVVLESTTYPGTTTEIVAPAIQAAGKRVQTADWAGGVLVAFSPEREDPGNTSVAREDIPKVVGGLTLTASQAAAAVYGAIFRRVITVSSPAVAEMTKLLENIYRCVNIALVNELKQLCLRMGVDIWEVIEAASSKPFGFQPFQPGPGLGGHCIPIDPFYLSWKAREYDFSTRFIELAGEVNEAMPYFVVQSVGAALNDRQKPLRGSKILVLGLAYKKDIDDLRESPSLTILDLLKQQGAEVSYNDPYFPRVGRGRKYALDMESQPLDDLGRYDCVLIVTDHSAYDYPRILREAQLVVDTRNATGRHIQPGTHPANLVRC